MESNPSKKKVRVEMSDERRMRSPLTLVIFAELELEATSLPNPHSTASKKFRLLLKEGTIVLRPLQFGQVRGSEEQSDELKKPVYGISTLIADTSVRIVAATNFATISNAIIPVNAPSSLQLTSLVADIVHVQGPGGRRRGH